MMNKIYLSYSFHDSMPAELLRGQLMNVENLSLVSLNPTVTSNNNVIKSISTELKSSHVVITFLSPNPVSDWVTYELQLAKKEGLEIFAINLMNGSDFINHPLLNFKPIVVDWNFNNLKKIIAGDLNTFSYQNLYSEREIDLIKIDFKSSAEKLNNYLISNPEYMHKLSARKFEEHVAYVLEKLGYEITLTQQTRDSGIDIFALKKQEIGKILTIVDCKKYAPDKPIGIGVVRNMYGTLNIEKASHAMIASTSYFTKDAKEFEKNYKFQISLKDHSDIIDWMKKI